MNNITKDQVFAAFSERRIGYKKALRLLDTDDYSKFLDEYFQAGYDYPDATDAEKEDVEREFQDVILAHKSS